MLYAGLWHLTTAAVITVGHKKPKHGKCILTRTGAVLFQCVELGELPLFHNIRATYSFYGEFGFIVNKPNVCVLWSVMLAGGSHTLHATDKHDLPFKCYDPGS